MKWKVAALVGWTFALLFGRAFSVMSERYRAALAGFDATLGLFMDANPVAFERRFTAGDLAPIGEHVRKAYGLKEPRKPKARVSRGKKGNK